MSVVSTLLLSSSLVAFPIFKLYFRAFLQFDPIVKCTNKNNDNEFLYFCDFSEPIIGRRVKMDLGLAWNKNETSSMAKHWKLTEFIDYLCKFSQHNIPFALPDMNYVLSVTATAAKSAINSFKVAAKRIKPVWRSQVVHYMNFHPSAVHAIDIETKRVWVTEVKSMEFISFKINLDLLLN